MLDRSMPTAEAVTSLWSGVVEQVEQNRATHVQLHLPQPPRCVLRLLGARPNRSRLYVACHALVPTL